MVEFAKDQVSLNPGASEVFKKFASISQSDAEVGCIGLFRKYGYTCPLPIQTVDLGGGRRFAKFPYVTLSSWAQWLLNTNRIWRLFCGCKSYPTMKLVLSEFWERYRAMFPSHEIFQAGIDLSVSIPYFTHQDEGRGYKHQGIWIFTVHGCLGRGTHEYLRRGKNLGPISRMEFGCNFVGNTWSTQFLIATMMRSVTHKLPGAMNQIVELFAEDAKQLAVEGISSADGSMKIHMIHVNTKGDLPALAKLGTLTRTFSHVPRAGASRTPSAGICHLCLAGQESSADQDAYPYEDFSTRPAWLPTMERVLPWRDSPAILEGVFLDRSRVASFFATDIWHNVSLGVGKHWIANSFVESIERLTFWPGASVESRFQHLTNGFKAFCQNHRISPHMDEISRATMGFPQGSACPIGQWSKGSVTTHFMKYLESFCDLHEDEIKDDEVMSTIVSKSCLAYFRPQSCQVSLWTIVCCI